MNFDPEYIDDMVMDFKERATYGRMFELLLELVKIRERLLVKPELEENDEILFKPVNVSEAIDLLTTIRAAQFDEVRSYLRRWLWIENAELIVKTCELFEMVWHRNRTFEDVLLELQQDYVNEFNNNYGVHRSITMEFLLDYQKYEFTIRNSHGYAD